MTKEPIEVRKYEPSTDKAYVYASWLNSYKTESYFAKRIRRGIFFDWHNRVIDNILLKPHTKVLIAHPKNEEDLILGYLVYEDKETPVIHFILVKEQFRKFGIATQLIQKAEIDLNKSIFTHWTYMITVNASFRSGPYTEFIEIDKKFPGLTYNPYEI